MIRLFKHYVPHAVLLLGVIDLALLLVANNLAWRLRASQIGMDPGDLLERLPSISLISIVTLTAMIAVGVYGAEALRSMRVAGARLLVAVSLAILGLAFLDFVLPGETYWRSILLYAMIFSIIFLMANRLVVGGLLGASAFRRRVLVLGAGNRAQRIRVLGEGSYAEARALKEELLRQFPGSVDIELLAGDVELLAGDSGAALFHYRSAAQVRSNWPLMRRMVFATVRNGNEAGARRMLASYLAQNPQEPAAAVLLGRMQRDAGNPARAAALLRYAGSNGAGKADPVLHAELAELEAFIGLPREAQASVRLAHGLQRSNRRVASIFARMIDIAGRNNEAAQALAAKASGSGTSQLAMR